MSYHNRNNNCRPGAGGHSNNNNNNNNNNNGGTANNNGQPPARTGGHGTAAAASAQLADPSLAPAPAAAPAIATVASPIRPAAAPTSAPPDLHGSLMPVNVNGTSVSLPPMSPTANVPRESDPSSLTSGSMDGSSARPGCTPLKLGESRSSPSASSSSSGGKAGEKTTGSTLLPPPTPFIAIDEARPLLANLAGISSIRISSIRIRGAACDANGIDICGFIGTPTARACSGCKKTLHCDFPCGYHDAKGGVMCHWCMGKGKGKACSANGIEICGFIGAPTARHTCSGCKKTVHCAFPCGYDDDEGGIMCHWCMDKVHLEMCEILEEANTAKMEGVSRAIIEATIFSKFTPGQRAFFEAILKRVEGSSA